MLFFHKKTEKADHSTDLYSLRKEIEETKDVMNTVQNHFEHVSDPTMIDCYIYELNAAQLRYQFLLRSFKNQEI